MAAAGHKRLVSARDVEIENAFEVADPLWGCLDSHFFERGISYERSANPFIVNTLYCETDGMDLLSSGFTLGSRHEGSSADNKQYKNRFLFKARHPGYQQAADEIADRLFPAQKFEGFRPYVRTEIERSSWQSSKATEFRLSDLPSDIAKAIGGKVSPSAALRPVFSTPVERRKYKFYLDVAQFHKSEGTTMIPGFMDIELVNNPTQKMKTSGKYICLELSLDEVVYSRPNAGDAIEEILESQGRNYGELGRRGVVEYEFKADASGKNITDEDLVATFTGFGLSLKGLDHELASQKAGYKPIQPAKSKAAIGFGLHPDYGAGPHRAAYEKALEYAP